MIIKLVLQLMLVPVCLALGALAALLILVLGAALVFRGIAGILVRYLARSARG